MAREHEAEKPAETLPNPRSGLAVEPTIDADSRKLVVDVTAV